MVSATPRPARHQSTSITSAPEAASSFTSSIALFTGSSSSVSLVSNVRNPPAVGARCRSLSASPATVLNTSAISGEPPGTRRMASTFISSGWALFSGCAAQADASLRALAADCDAVRRAFAATNTRPIRKTAIATSTEFGSIFFLLGTADGCAGNIIAASRGIIPLSLRAPLASRRFSKRSSSTHFDQATSSY